MSQAYSFCKQVTVSGAKELPSSPLKTFGSQVVDLRQVQSLAKRAQIHSLD